MQKESNFVLSRSTLVSQRMKFCAFQEYSHMSQRVGSRSTWEIQLKGFLLILRGNKIKIKLLKKKKNPQINKNMLIQVYLFPILSAVLLRHPKIILVFHLVKCSYGIYEIRQSRVECLKHTVKSQQLTHLVLFHIPSSIHQFSQLLSLCVWDGRLWFSGAVSLF